MVQQIQEQRYNGKNTITFLGGMLMGGLAGAVTALLLAPQSGKKTRDQIQAKGIELRDQATEAVGDAMTQVSRTARQITGNVNKKAKELQQQGQDMFDEQRKRLSAFVEG